MCRNKRENRIVSSAHVPLSWQFPTDLVFKKSNMKEETSEWGGKGPLSEQQLSATAHYTSLAVLGLVHHTEKQWKFILATKQGLLLKLLLGKEMDQGVYIQFYYLSEQKFLSRRRSVGVQTLQP